MAISSNKNNEDQRCGTILYEAPEQLFAINQYTKAVDIWACGVVMYELLTLGGHPIIDRLNSNRSPTDILNQGTWVRSFKSP